MSGLRQAPRPGSPLPPVCVAGGIEAGDNAAGRAGRVIREGPAAAAAWGKRHCWENNPHCAATCNLHSKAASPGKQERAARGQRGAAGLGAMHPKHPRHPLGVAPAQPGWGAENQSCPCLAHCKPPAPSQSRIK